MEWIKSFLAGPFTTLACAIWNGFMHMVIPIAETTPMSFSEVAWSYVEAELYPWALAIGVVLFNLFFMIALIRAAGDFKRNITIEGIIEAVIRLVLSNALMVGGLDLIRGFFTIASGLVECIGAEGIFLTAPSTDLSNIITDLVVGLIACIAAPVCGVMILLVVYGRIFQLYLLTVVAPISLSSIAGGGALAQTGYSWIRTFLAKTFEIVVVMLTLAIAGKIIGHIDFLTFSGVGSVFDGVFSTIQMTLQMVLVTASVKGVESFMKRSFNL